MTSGSERRVGLVAGLLGLMLWLSSGLVLEGLHAWKSPAYLEDPVRRLMLTLAHAHGTLLSALTLLLTLSVLPALALSRRWSLRAERLFALGSVLLPLGFLVGGLWHPEGDPGWGIALVPVGAACCIASLGIATWGVTRGRRGGGGA